VIKHSEAAVELQAQQNGSEEKNDIHQYCSPQWTTIFDITHKSTVCRQICHKNVAAEGIGQNSQNIMVN